MKWVSHEIVTGALVYLTTDDLVLTACAMTGAVIPDRLDGDPRRASNYWLWRKFHRGISHWLAPYLTVIVLLLSISRGIGGAMSPVVSIPIAVMAGACLHILEDAVCGKVPLFFPGEKIGLKLFAVGSFTEYFFCIAVVVLAYAAKALATIGS